MRKSFLTFVAIVTFTFSTSAQCGEQSTQVNTSCASYCVSMVVPLTGDLSSDIENLEATNGTLRRKPNLTELVDIANQLEDEC